MSRRLLLSGLSVSPPWPASRSRCAPATRRAPALFDRTQGPELTRFASAEAFETYLRSRPPAPAAGRRPGCDRRRRPMAETAAPAAADARTAYGQPANPEITNNQTVGVDEGGIVKQIGRFLRRAAGRAAVQRRSRRRRRRAAAARRPDRRLSQPGDGGELV